MSNAYLDPSSSPNTLEKSGPGVRRMNKIPIVLGVVTIGIIISVMAYAAHQRSNRNQTAELQTETSVQPRSAQDGANALLQGYDTDGTIEPVTSFEQSEEMQEQAEDEVAIEPISVEQQPQTIPSPQNQLVLDEAAQQRIERAQKFREDMFYDAVVSDTTVKIPESEQSNQSSGRYGFDRPSAGVDRAIAQQKIAQTIQASRDATNGLAADLPSLSSAESDPNLQARKDEFQQTERTYGYSTEFRRDQLTPYEIRVGTVIPAVMIGGINSDLPGQIIAQISQNVRDTKTGRHILIPQGAKLIGTYDSHIAMGQRRVMVGWHRIQFPDGSTLELGNMGGTDQAGNAGFKDKVNNHYWRIFGNATLLSLISAGAQLSQPESDGIENSAREQLAAELGRQWGQVGQQMVRRNLNIQPTIEIRPGYRFNVMVNKDLILKPEV